MAALPTVTVVGSINMDLIVTAGRMPDKGETILGESFATSPGGKGANQAVAAAKAGANVNMIGALGTDEFGRQLLENFKSTGVDTTGIHLSTEEATGIATVLLSENDNRIIVTPGANQCVTSALVMKNQQLLLASDVVIMQLEIPLETVVSTAAFCQEQHIPLIINPAPYRKLPAHVMEMAAYLTPNELEMQAIKQESDVQHFAEKFIVTKGAEGVCFHTGDYSEASHQPDRRQSKSRKEIPAFAVTAVDTTGAGDTFNGVLAAKIASGEKLADAVLFANAAAALSVTRFGAQAGMPSAEQVRTFLKEQE